ncbi:hypothetical protein N657DRAFT_619285 [Parathielavia appendiculata]|uniref:Cytoplasmic tRNA 2-thiolation protein 2 n=1 Tax=Parathielavia appendiculata TaxID=2587402 RepID=A0AAN6U057_9PEZI|nr:hypothetical protein N657DRAFT_619285 [Parathielavia appendiculata]
MVESKSSEPLPRPCEKCRIQEATLDSRSHPVCRDCFIKFIGTKCIKQIGLLGKETRPPAPSSGGRPTGTRHYLLGLSLGVSSTVLLHLLNENVEFQLAKGRNAPFDLTVVHIDTTTTITTTLPTQTQQPTSTTPSPSLCHVAEKTLEAYRARYPRFTFITLPLSSALTSSSASAFTSTTDDRRQPDLPYLFETSSSSTTTTAASREDVTRHLTRRALQSQARARGCQALLLGHSTTALAELTLAEAAKGRGFALPWVVGDGPAPPASIGLSLGGEGGEPGDGDGGGEEDEHYENKDKDRLLVYHPLRDALRKELVIYAGLVEPPLTELIQADKQDDGLVVSHKDLSIEEVMTRYFADVEESYPSVVANVTRTTGKLVRAGEEGAEICGLCGLPLDEDGDERWRGELGIQKRSGTATATWLGRLCYGCERSTAG